MSIAVHHTFYPAMAVPFSLFRKSPNFNKEDYVDFVAAQIKTLSFLAYIIRIYQDVVNTYSQNMVGGMLGLLRYCPQEVAHLRKELLIATKHILATDLRNCECYLLHTVHVYLVLKDGCMS